MLEAVVGEGERNLEHFETDSSARGHVGAKTKSVSGLLLCRARLDRVGGKGVLGKPQRMGNEPGVVHFAQESKSSASVGSIG